MSDKQEQQENGVDNYTKSRLSAKLLAALRSGGGE